MNTGTRRAPPSGRVSALVAPTALAASTLAVLTLLGAPAEAKSRLGLELKLGGGGAFTSYLTDTTIVLEDAQGERQAFIGDVENAPGLAISALLTFRNFEVGISTYAFPWSEGELNYAGVGEVRNVSEFNVDDAGVVYSALDTPRYVDVTEFQVSTRALTFTPLDVGYRYYIREEGFFEAYIPMGGGLILNGDPLQCELVIACGLHAFGGIRPTSPWAEG